MICFEYKIPDSLQKMIYTFYSGWSWSVCPLQENVDPALQVQQEGGNQPTEEQKLHRRELTVVDEQEIWKDITLTQ